MQGIYVFKRYNGGKVYLNMLKILYVTEFVLQNGDRGTIATFPYEDNERLDVPVEDFIELWREAIASTR